MIIVALAPVAKSTTAAETSSPTTEWKVPPSEATSCWARPIRRSSALRRPSVAITCTASSSAPAARWASRAPRRIRVSLSAPPVTATTMRSLAGQGCVDLVRAPVVVERVVDPVGQPEQRQLAQRGEVADPEVRRERGVDLLGLVDVAVRHPPAQRVGRHVDQLDLVGGADHLVRHGLALPDPGDPLDLVVERLEVLDVDGGDDVDARRRGAPRRPAARFSCRLPGTLVCASSSTQHHRRLAGDDRRRCPSR